MASNYKSLKCDCCAGALEYSKEKKVWVCMYCGNEIRREEEYDGLYTIKNVVRQTIVEVAYGNLDSARKNLAECEKIDSRYIGTMIARLCVQMFTFSTPGCCPEGAAKSLIGQMKRGYEEIQQMDTGISTEEEALYEAFEDHADAFAVLVLVFDSLGDHVHRDFAENLLDASRIYAPSINEKMLRYAMRNKNLVLADAILENADNLPCRSAFQSVLSEYADGVKKREHVERLAARAGLVSDDRKWMEQYLEESGDSLETRICVYRAGVEAGAAANIQCVTEFLLERAGDNAEAVKQITELVGKSRLNDAELYYLVGRIFAGHGSRMALTELEMLEKSGIYIVVSSKDLLAMLNRKNLTTEEKKLFLDTAHRLSVDVHTNEIVLTEYLNQNQDDSKTRIQILKKLLSYVNNISTAALTQYITKSTTDGEQKPEIVELLFALELNLSFFRGLLQTYMKEAPDGGEVKEKIIQILSRAGLQVDAGTLIDMACAADEHTAQETIAFIRKMTQSGIRLRNDALSIYLEKAPDHRYFAGMIGALYSQGSILSGEALNNYVLYAKMDETVKVENITTFAGQCSELFGSGMCVIKHLNSTVRCNLFQAYVLTAKESEPTAVIITEKMKSAGARLNMPIEVNGVSMKFKKYVVDNRAAIGGLTEKLCADNRVFSILF